jgi:hypothetical protein
MGTSRFNGWAEAAFIAYGWIIPELRWKCRLEIIDIKSP